MKTFLPFLSAFFCLNLKLDSARLQRILIGTMLWWGGAVVLGQPVISSFSPAANAHNVSLSADVQVIFSQTMLPATINSNTFVVNGDLRGYRTTTITVSGDTATLSPDVPFLPGELVTVTVDSAVRSPSGPMGVDFQWQFQAKGGLGPAQFADEQQQSVGTYLTNDIVLGDLDGDGDLDAFETNQGFSGNATEPNRVWINQGDGTFINSGQNLGNNVSARSALGDLNGNGFLDAFVANFNGPGSRIYFNNGNGNFSDSNQNLPAVEADAIALGDLDGDGDLDAVECIRNNNSRIWLNDGNGYFNILGQVFSNSGLGNYGAAIGDLDGDGHMDIFLTPTNGVGSTEVWINDGNGSFTGSQSVSANGTAQSITLGDLDGDGDLDAAIGISGQANQVWTNNGSGFFINSGALSGNGGGRYVEAGDLDGDGDLDLIFAIRNQANEIWINDGSANFTLSSQTQAVHYSRTTALGDLDGDGDLDFFEADWLSSLPNKVWLNQIVIESISPAANATAAPQNSDVVADFYSNLTSVDSSIFVVYGNLLGYRRSTITVNNDVMTLSPDIPFAPGEIVSVLLDSSIGTTVGPLDYDRQWSFRAEAGSASAEFSVVNFASASFGVDVGDLDGDGDIDAIIVGSSLVNILINNGSGTLTSTTQNIPISGDCRDVCLADFNGDGNLDAFVARTGANRVLINNGSANFSATSQNLGSSVSLDAKFADLDGDGDLDVLVANSNNPSQIWINDGNGDFTPDSGSTLPSANGVALEDLNGDGYPDAIFGTSAPNQVWINDGSGSLSFNQAIGNAGMRRIALGDFDGDGDLDAFAANDVSSRVWRNNGSGSLSSWQTLALSGLDATIGDLDGDGDLDVLLGRSGSQSEVLINNGSGILSSGGTVLGAFYTPQIELADMDGDGDLDGVTASGKIYFNQNFFNLASANPAFNSHTAPLNTDLTFQFSDSVDTATVDSSKVLVYGNMTGKRHGVLTTVGSTVTFNPDAPFFPGEKIEIVLDSTISGPLLDLGKDVHGQFRAMAAPAPGTMVLDSPILGNQHGDHVAFGDLDQDGDLDAFVSKYGPPNEVWLNNGKGHFVNTLQSLGNSNTRRTRLGDLDGDGDLDAFSVNFNTSPNKVWINDGTGVFAFEGTNIGNASSVDAGLADLDDDGDLDAYVANFSSDQVWTNDGLGGFSAILPGISNGNASGVALGDLDQDGDIDAYVGLSGTVPDQVWKNDGTGNFINTNQSIGNFYTEGVGMGDFNGDGHLDVFAPNRNGSDRIWINDGAGFFTTGSTVGGNLPSYDIALGDVDGDGDLDAISVARDGFANKLYLNNGGGSFADSGEDLGLSDSRGVAIGDLDGDGDLDAFITNRNNEPNFVYFNQVGLDSISPPAGANSVAPNTHIFAKFDDDLQGASIDSTDMALHGSLTGYRRASINVTNDSLTLIPNTPFLPGEKVEVLLDSSLSTVFGPLGYDIQWSFRSEAAEASAIFLTQSFSNIGGEMAVGDLNGDGDPDIVQVRFGTSVPGKVHFNNGNGTYTISGQNLLTTTACQRIQLADLNGDGHLDAFVAADGGNVVLINNGAGILDSVGPALGTANTLGLDIADVDADGDMDVMTANPGNGITGKLWINNGSGGFTDSDQSLSENARDVALADLDGDGDYDAYFGRDGLPAEVWLNDGLGTFSNSGQSLGNAPVQNVCLGDLDGDGDTDAFQINTTNCQVFENNGSGTFSLLSTLATGANERGALGDLDGDGDLDILLARTGAKDTVLLNGGNATFNGGVNIGLSSTTEAVVLADVDGDGDLDGITNTALIYFNQNDLDLIASNPEFNTHNAVLSTDLAFTFNDSVNAASVDSSKVIVHGNMKGDRTGNITVVDSTITLIPTVPFMPGEQVEIMLDSTISGTILSIGRNIHGKFRAAAGPGPAQFEESPQNFGNYITFHIALGDLDGDGDLDAFESNGDIPANNYQEPNRVWINQGDGTFVNSGQNLGNALSHRTALGDLDGDGDLDAFTANVRPSASRIYFNNGNGNFIDSNQNLPNSQSHQIVLGDLDGDGDLDAVECIVGNNSKIWLNNGSGFFTILGQTFSNGGNGNYDAGIGDLDGDGDLDIFLTPSTTAASQEVWINNGSGSFTAKQNLPSTSSARSIALGDLDADGDLDAVIAYNSSIQPNEVWFNDGEANFTLSDTTLGLTPSVHVELGDLEGDGDLDIVFANFSSDPNDIWINNGAASFMLSTQTLGNSNSYAASLGDLDGDGDLDIFEAIYSSSNKVWFNKIPPATLLSIFPDTNAGNAALNTVVEAIYDSTVSLASLQPETFAIHGSFSGYRQGSYEVSGDTARLVPDLPFLPGERVHVLADKSVGAAFSGSRSDFHWQFTVTAPSGYAKFADDGQLSLPTDTRDVALGDLDHDGDLDAVVGLGSSTLGNLILLNNNGTLINSQQSLGPDSTGSIVLGDLDNDGDLDILEAVVNGPQRVYLNQGNGFFNPDSSFGTAQVGQTALGDIDRDGDLDAVVATLNGSNQIWYNNGHARFNLGGTDLDSADAYAVELADFDKDGNLDVYLGIDGASDQLWINFGNGTFTNSQQILGLDDTRAVEVADLNGDQNLDVVVANATSATHIAYLNDGNGNLIPGAGFGTGIPGGLALGDLDGDGDPDVYSARDNGQPDRIFINDGNGNFPPEAQNLGLSWNGRIALGDLDGDGDLDGYASNSFNGVNNTLDKIWINCEVPNLDLGPDTSICDGGSVLLNAGAGILDYTWNDGSKNQILNVDSTGTYSVVVSNLDGCAVNDTMRLWVQPIPPADFSGLDSAGYCLADTISLSAKRKPYALRLDGSNDYLTVVGYPGITGTAPRTLEAWIRPLDDLQNGAVIAFWGTPGGGTQMQLRLNNNPQSGQVGALMIDVGTGWKTGTTVLNDSLWHHVAMTWEDEGSADIKDAKLYVDGIEEFYSSVNANSVNTLPGLDFRIGKGPTTGMFEGQIDEIRLWNRTLSPFEITANQFTEYSATTPNLEGLYLFEAGPGNAVAADSSGNGRHATLVNMDVQANWVAISPGLSRVWDMGDGTFYNGLALTHTYASSGGFQVSHEVSSQQGCVATENFFLTVSPLPTVFIGNLPASYCINDPVSSLIVGIPASPPGVFSGPGITDNLDGTATFNPAVAGIGTATISYSYGNSGGCPNVYSTNVTVHPLPVVSIDSIPLLYLTSGQPQNLLGIPPGGTFSGSGPGVSGGQFIPSIADTGFYTISYSYTSMGCENTASVQVEVIGPGSATIAGILNNYCANDSSNYQLSGIPYDPNGVFLGPGIDSNGVFNPAIAGVGTHLIEYQFRDSTTQLPSFVQRTISVSPATSMTFNPVSGVFCEGDPTVNLLDSVVGFPNGGTTTFNGFGIINAAGFFNATVAGAGVHPVTARYTAPNGCAAEDSINITVLPPPIGQIANLQMGYCFSDSGDTLIGLPSGGTFSGAGISGNVFTPDFAGAGTHIIEYAFVDSNGCSGLEQVAIVVYPEPPTSFSGLAINYCAGDSAVSLTGIPSGGAFIGPGITDSQGGIFTPDSAGTGLHEITYQRINTNGCLTTSSQYVAVDTVPIVNFTGLADTYCLAAGPDSLVASPPGGTYIGYGIFGGNRFRPAFAGIGNHTISYTFVDNNGCSTEKRDTTTVFPLPAAAVQGPTNGIFFDTDSIQLNLVAGTPPSGIFTGPGIIDNMGSAHFDPGAAQGGNHTIFYTVTDSLTGCANSVGVSVIVIPVGSVGIDGLAADYCLEDIAIDTLRPFPDTTLGWFEGPGVDSAGHFVPELAGVGIHLMRFVYSSGQDTAYGLTQVHANPAVSFQPGDPDLCITDPVANLFGQGAPIGGTFSGPGVQGTGIDPAAAGLGSHQIVYAYTNVFGQTACSGRDTATFVVHPLPIDSIQFLQAAYCISDSAVPLLGYGNFPQTSFKVAGTPDSVFNPAQLSPGTWTVNYSFTDSLSCSNTVAQSVVVNPLPNPVLNGLAQSYCVDADSVQLIGAPGGGTFSGPGVVDSIAGLFLPSAAGIGLHTVRYRVVNANGCTAEVTQTVRIDTLPVVNLSSPVMQMCRNENPITLSGSPILGLYAGGGITSATGGIYNPAQAPAGQDTVIYTFKDGNQCQASDTVVITVDTVPVVSLAGLDSLYCRGDSPDTLMALPVAGLFTGMGITDDSLGIFNPNVAPLGIHTIQYSFTDANGCHSKSKDTTQVNPIPVAFFTGVQPEYCLYDAPDTLNGIISSGSFSWPVIQQGGQNVFDPDSAGSFTIVHSVTVSGCTGLDSASVIVHPLPVVYFSGLDSQYCQTGTNAVEPLTGSPSGPSGIFDGTDGIWQNSGFQPDSATPGTHQVWYTYTDSNSCVNADTQFVVVDTLPVVSFNPLPDTMCQNDPAIVLTGQPDSLGSYYFVGPTTWVVSSPDTLFDPTQTGPGSHSIVYDFTDRAGCSASDTDFVEVMALPSVVFTLADLIHCPGDSIAALTGSPPGGVYTGRGILANNAWYADLAGIGRDTIRYSFTDNLSGCSDDSAQVVQVFALPEPEISGFPDSLCSDAASVTLMASPSGGIFSGAIDSTVFDPVVENPGRKDSTFAIYYSYTDSNACVGWDTVFIRVDSVPEPRFDSLDLAYCKLPDGDTLRGFPYGGVFSGNGISNDSIFFPVVADTGWHVIAYQFGDSRGCSATFSDSTRVNPLPVVAFTGLDSVYCLNAADSLLAGYSSIPGGVGIFSGNGIRIDSIQSDTFFSPSLAMAGVHPITYVYTDSNGCEGIESRFVEVKSLPNVQIFGLDSIYCDNEPNDTLNGIPSGGQFFQGVVQSNEFSPADSGTGLHTVSYWYQDAVGCRDTVHQITEVLPSPVASISNLPAALCGNANSIQVFANPPGGTFSGPGMTGGNVFDPNLVIDSVANVVYSFTASNNCIDRDTQVVQVLGVPMVSFTGLEPEYCRNDPTTLLTGTPGGGTFSGTGFLPNPNRFDPASVLTGSTTLSYRYTNADSCSDTAEQTVTIRAVPEPGFFFAGECIGEATQFTDTSTLDSGQSVITTWQWDFGDGNTSTLQNPTHNYANSGPDTVWLKVITNFGCADSVDARIDIGEDPVAQMTWQKVCLGDQTEFFDQSAATPIDPVNAWSWDFGDGGQSNQQDPQHIFANDSIYPVSLAIETAAGCRDTLVRMVGIRDLISNFPYSEDFGNGQKGWLLESPPLESSWEFGVPQDSTVFGAVSGDTAWVTKLNGFYQSLEQSRIESPCFDLSSLSRPMIKMDLAYDTEPGFDGAVLQVTSDGGLSWNNLGEVNSGQRWFNTIGIVGDPGGTDNPQNEGWSGSTGGHWVNARHKLDSFTDPSHTVRFRVAFGSDGQNVKAGFAFDDIWIGERNKKILLEHYTNSSAPASVSANLRVDSIVDANPNDMVAVHYHYGSGDTFYAQNQADANGRRIELGVTAPPWSLLDVTGYNGTPSGINAKLLDTLMLQNADFIIDGLSVSKTGNVVSASGTFTYQGDTLLSDAVSLFLVVVEREITSVTGSNGETRFEWVMKKMLPDATGTFDPGPWTNGRSRTVSQTWTLSNSQQIYDSDMLSVVAFLSNDRTRKVLQAEYEGPDLLTETVEGTEPGGTYDLVIFPNPAQEFLNVFSSGPRIEELRLVNVLGQVVWEGTPKRNRARIALDGVADGVYFVQVRLKGEVVSRRVVVGR